MAYSTWHIVKGNSLRATRYVSRADKGFSLVELLVISTIMLIVGGSIFLAIDPVEIRKKARDAKRISDLTELARIIDSYAADHGNAPPDVNVTVRRSNQPPTGNANASGTGWIQVDLSGYAEKLPVDPKNTDALIYRYYRSGNLYKLDATLEYQTSFMNNAKDGGNDANHYEVGSGADTITIP